ncbi:hypothetical protein T4A_4952, partial [Trichinella pseudospiralis]
LIDFFFLLSSAFSLSLLVLQTTRHVIFAIGRLYNIHFLQLLHTSAVGILLICLVRIGFCKNDQSKILHCRTILQLCFILNYLVCLFGWLQIKKNVAVVHLQRDVFVDLDCVRVVSAVFFLVCLFGCLFVCFCEEKKLLEKQIVFAKRRRGRIH